MADIFWDGFDKYGPVNQALTAMAPGLLGEWTSGSGTIALVSGRFANSLAVQLTASSTLLRSLPGNYPRLIGGVAIQPNLVSYSGVNFLDGATKQCSLSFPSTGKLTLTNGDLNGTVLGVASAAITANSWHYLEWDITFGSAGAYSVWLDGVLQFSGTGATKSSANAYANGIGLATWTVSVVTSFDDLYLFDNTGSVNNAVRGDSRVETLFPVADASVQFAQGQGVVGFWYSLYGTTSDAPGANILYLRRVVPGVSGALQSLGLMPSTSSTTANFKPAVYADNNGAPGSLLSAGSAVTGCTSGASLTLPLTSPPTLTAGTPVWIGFLGDSAITFLRQDNNNTATSLGFGASVTYSSGVPSTAPTMGSGRSSTMIWGNVTPSGSNAGLENLLPPGGDLSCVQSSTVGQEDRYSFAALSSTPLSVAGVKLSALVRKSDTGSRTLTLQMKSGTTEIAGAAQAPASSYTYVASYFDTDPATGAAWTASGINALSAGIKVAS